MRWLVLLFSLTALLARFSPEAVRVVPLDAEHPRLDLPEHSFVDESFHQVLEDIASMIDNYENSKSPVPALRPRRDMTGLEHETPRFPWELGHWGMKLEVLRDVYSAVQMLKILQERDTSMRQQSNFISRIFRPRAPTTQWEFHPPLPYKDYLHLARLLRDLSFLVITAPTVYEKDSAETFLREFSDNVRCWGRQAIWHEPAPGIPAPRGYDLAYAEKMTSALQESLLSPFILSKLPEPRPMREIEMVPLQRSAPRHSIIL